MPSIAESLNAQPGPDSLAYWLKPFQGYWDRQGRMAREGLAMADQGAQQVRGGDLSGLAGMAFGPMNYLSSPINALFPVDEAYTQLPKEVSPFVAGGLELMALAAPGPKTKGLGRGVGALVDDVTDADRAALQSRLQTEATQTGGLPSSVTRDQALANLTEAPELPRGAQMVHYKVSHKSSGVGTRVYKIPGGAKGEIIVEVQGGNWHDPGMSTVNWGYGSAYKNRPASFDDAWTIADSDKSSSAAAALKDFRAVADVIKHDAQKFNARGYKFTPADEAFRTSDTNKRLQIYKHLAERIKPGAPASEHKNIPGMVQIELRPHAGADDLEAAIYDKKFDPPYMTESELRDWIASQLGPQA